MILCVLVSFSMLVFSIDVVLVLKLKLKLKWRLNFLKYYGTKT